MNRQWCLNGFDPAEIWAAGLAAKGWGRVRVEGTDYGLIMEQCQRHSIWPLWILDRGEEVSVPSGIAVEIGNEHNAGIGKWSRLTPTEYAAWVNRAAPTLLAKGCQVYVGSINNFSRSAMDWLRRVLELVDDDLVWRLHLSAHRYLDPDQNVCQPKKGFSSIPAEEQYWLDTTRGLPWAVTECGIVDATYRDWSSWKYFGKKRVRLAVDGHREQARRLLALGAEFYTVYQINDGPSSAFDDQCGIRTIDGKWKPTADLPMMETV